MKDYSLSNICLDHVVKEVADYYQKCEDYYSHGFRNDDVSFFVLVCLANHTECSSYFELSRYVHRPCGHELRDIMDLADEMFQSSDQFRTDFEIIWQNLYDKYQKTGFYIENGKLIEYVGCDTTVKIPDGVHTICNSAFSHFLAHSSEKPAEIIKRIILPDSVRKVEWCTFSGMKRLKEVRLSEKMTTIDKGLFMNTPTLTEIHIPYSVSSIQAGAFYNSKIRRVTLPYGLKRIEYGAFKECRALYKINIPPKLTYLNPTAFEKCKKLDRSETDKFLSEHKNEDEEK